MTETFGDSAVGLCGAASILLGWRPAEFWESTPAELAAALQGFGAAPDSPDAKVMDALRRQFPDN